MAFPSVSRGFTRQPFHAVSRHAVSRHAVSRANRSRGKWFLGPPSRRYPSPKRCPQLATTKGTRYDPSPRNYRHRTRHGISACYGDGELVTTHPATDSEHHITGGI